MEAHADFTQDPTFYEGVKDEQQLWEEVLRQHGLSMTAGFVPNVLYGNDGGNALVPKMTYEKPPTNARQKGRNRNQADKLNALVSEGLSLYAAAKQLGMAPTHAYRTMRRYQSNFTQDPTSYEGEGTR